MGNLDRTKNDIDVMEHVFGGISASASNDDRRSGGIVNQYVRWRRWLGVSTGTSVHITLHDDESTDR